MKEIWKEARWLLVAGGMPCLSFMIAILIAFQVAPYDAEEASRILMTGGITGGLVGIFIVVHRIRQLLKRCS